MSKTGTLYYSVLSYKPQNQIELYGNVSQNYRSVTFNDIRTVSPSNVIDPNISERIYFRHWYTWTIRQSNLTPVYTVCITMTKLGSMKLVTQMDLLL
jgi:outer membrane receptor protein involved in Fe transport